MGITSKNQRLISYKKILGKSHSSSQKGEATEQYPSSIQLGVSFIFGEEIPLTPPSPSIDNHDLIVKKVVFELVPILESQYKVETTEDDGENDDGSVQQSNIHAWRLKLPADYSDTQQKFSQGTFVSDNNKLQIVPPTYGQGYKVRVFSDENLSQEMYASGQQEWILDYFSGILFVQDVFETLPQRVIGYIYTGKYLDELIQEPSTTTDFWSRLNSTDITTSNNVNVYGTNGAYYSNISFNDTYNDQAFVGHRRWIDVDNINNSELLLVKGKSNYSPSNNGRIRLAAPIIAFDTSNADFSSLTGVDFEDLSTTSFLQTRMIIKEDGKVGIGTISPESTFDVRGQIISQISSTGNNSNITIKKVGNPADNNVSFTFSHRSEGNRLWLYSSNGSDYKNFVSFRYDANKVYFPADTSNGIIIDIYNKRFGVGTDQPLQPLHVVKGVSNQTAITTSIAVFENSANGFISILTPNGNQGGVVFGSPNSNVNGGIIYDHSQNSLQLRTNANNTRMFIDSNGNVGIGLTAPGELLDVRTTTATVGQGARIGEVKIGTWEGGTSWAAFTHNSVHATSNSYALMQNNTGKTLLNAASEQTIEFRINNSTIGTVQSNRIEIGSHTDTSLRSYYDEFFENQGLPVAGTDSSTTTINNYGLYVKGSAFIEGTSHLNILRTKKSIVSGQSYIHDGFLQIKQNLTNDNSGYSPRGLTLVSPNDCSYRSWKIYLSDSTSNGRNGESLSFYFVDYIDYSSNPNCDPGIGVPTGTTTTNLTTGLRGYINSDATDLALNFTGQHRNQSETIDLNKKEEYLGLIVVSDGTYASLKGNNITINESLPKVSLASKRNQKSVFGVISDAEDESAETREYALGNFVSVSNKTVEDTRLIINSLGEGGIWICNVNGNLENGDYITTCEVPGYGMKQDDDLLHNYTVAKITCDCDFDLQSPIYICEEFEHEGKIYKKAFVGCTYHCG